MKQKGRGFASGNVHSMSVTQRSETQAHSYVLSLEKILVLHCDASVTQVIVDISAPMLQG